MKVKLTCTAKSGEVYDVEFTFHMCAVAGYTGRDKNSVMKHIEELKTIGISPPSSIPEIYWIDPSRVTPSDTIYVIGEQTSGEVEVFIAFSQNGEPYITVASDHTDRSLEKISTSKSKQVCNKIIGKSCWKMSDVINHWDDILLESSVKTSADGKYTPYQRGTLKNILPPEEIIAFARGKNPYPHQEIAIFSGTIPILSRKTIFAESYIISMHDPVFGRTITHSYRVVTLPDKR